VNGEGAVGATAEGWVEITEMGVLTSQREATGDGGAVAGYFIWM